MDRYLRHSIIDWFSQENVKASSFAVIGCGAIGNEVAKNLSLLGVGKIDLYDFDKVEIHNLTRSILFREHDIGKSKVEAAASRLIDLDPSVEINTYEGDFWDTLPLGRLASYSCVICCVDNIEARIKINKLCLLTSTHLINTGIDSKNAVAEVFPFQTNQSAACYECTLSEIDYTQIQERYSCGMLRKKAFIEKKIPTTIITSSLAGSLATSKALNILHNPIYNSNRIFIDSFTGHSTVSRIKKNDECFADHIENVVIHNTPPNLKHILKIFYEYQLADDHSIITSDLIVTSYRCDKCEHTKTRLFNKAQSYDSDLEICTQCGTDSVNVETRDIFSVESFNSCSIKELPCKYVAFYNESSFIILDLDKTV
jgi:molybdopterin-synthase adenylyltransferase